VAATKFELVPDEVDVIVFLADRRRGPSATAGPSNEIEAGVYSGHVIVQIGTGQRSGADVVVFEFGWSEVARRYIEGLDEASVVHGLLLAHGRRNPVGGAERCPPAVVIVGAGVRHRRAANVTSQTLHSS
jgi:hypothetical protein